MSPGGGGCEGEGGGLWLKGRRGGCEEEGGGRDHQLMGDKNGIKNEERQTKCEVNHSSQVTFTSSRLVKGRLNITVPR